MSPRTKAGLALVLLVVAALVWLTGQLAAILYARRWLDVSADELIFVVLKLPFTLDDPRYAWPPHAWGDLPGPLGMYAAGLAVAGIPSLVALRLLRALGRRLLGDRFSGRLSWRARQPGSTMAAGGGWASLWELRGLLGRPPQPGRVPLGRVLTGQTSRLASRLGLGVVDRLRAWVEGCHSLLVFGPPGSFKTTALIIPTICDWFGAVIATSVKADIINATRAARATRGEVIILDPLGGSGLGTHRWSPLGACTTYAGAQQVAAAIAATEHLAQAGAEHRFWVELAEQLLAPLLFAAANSRRAMVDVVGWLQHHPHDPLDEQEGRGCRRRPCPIEEITGILARLNDALALGAWQATLGRAEGDSRLLGSIYATAEKLTKVYADARVAVFTAGNDLDWAAILTGPNTVYLYAPPDEQDRLRPIFEVILTDALKVAQQLATEQGGMLHPRLLLALDEAGNVAALADLPRWATIARGLGIQLVTVWHDLSQLADRYGQRATTVLNAHRAKVFLSGLADLDTLDVASRLIGEQAVTERAETRGHDGDRSQSEHLAYRPLLPPDALRRLRPGEGVVVYGHLRPFRIRLCPWFEEPGPRRRARWVRRTLRRLERSDPQPARPRAQVEASATADQDQDEPVVPLPLGQAVPSANGAATHTHTKRLPHQLSPAQWDRWRRGLHQHGHQHNHNHEHAGASTGDGDQDGH